MSAPKPLRLQRVLKANGRSVGRWQVADTNFALINFRRSHADLGYSCSAAAGWHIFEGEGKLPDGDPHRYWHAMAQRWRLAHFHSPRFETRRDAVRYLQAWLATQGANL